MVTTPWSRPDRGHPDATCLCQSCKRARYQLRRTGHHAPEPHWPRKEHPNLEAELRELY
jgi:hypothetical protein